MAFVLESLPSPVPQEIHQIGPEEILPHALSSLSLPSATASTASLGLTAPSPPADADMGRDRPRLEILLDAPIYYLKGTGVDVEPARLSGQVVLQLSAPTSVKEITLSFRGKAKTPAASNDALSLNTSSHHYLVCHHEWSFLEGDKKHSHTLKAGRHYFPFQLLIGGSLPSSLSSTILGGAAISYKLRAQVVRPGFNSNLHATAPVTILRSLGPEALEYQQTLEIENTWPEKMMYSIMIPHKAWAAGDRLSSVLKFSPLRKGICVMNVTTSVHESTKFYSKSGNQEFTRTIGTTRYELVGGRAVEVDYFGRVQPSTHSSNSSASSSASSEPHGNSTTTNVANQHSSHGSTPSPPPPPSRRSSDMRPSSSHSVSSTTPCVPRISPFTSNAGPGSPHRPSSSHGHSELSDPSLSASASGSSGRGSTDLSSYGNEHMNELEGMDDIVITLNTPVPLKATPTHPLDPITVGHRIRWSIIILNPDGHTSELRCSLPIHILDYELLDEAKSLTAATRRLMLGGPEPSALEEEDRELPSYTAHVRDRIANIFVPEAATVRMTNPWVAAHSGAHADLSTLPSPLTSPVHPGPMGHHGERHDGFFSRLMSGHASPHEMTSSPLGHLPAMPGSGDSESLNWLNSELLLSVSTAEQMNQQEHNYHTSSEPGSNPVTRPPSRLNSRDTSPDRHGNGHTAHGPHTGPAGADRHNTNVNHGHGHGHGSHHHHNGPVHYESYIHETSANRGSHVLLSAEMKSYNPLAHNWLSSSHHHHSFPSLSGITHWHQHHHYHGHGHNQRSATDPHPSGRTGGHNPILGLDAISNPYANPYLASGVTSTFIGVGHDLHMTSTTAAANLSGHTSQRAFTEVPDYAISSRGIVGGLLPLESMRGLPTYEEANAGRRSSESGSLIGRRATMAMSMVLGRRGSTSSATSGAVEGDNGNRTGNSSRDSLSLRSSLRMSAPPFVIPA